LLAPKRDDEPAASRMPRIFGVGFMKRLPGAR
jgi:hypothetical protein